MTATVLKAQPDVATRLLAASPYAQRRRTTTSPVILASALFLVTTKEIKEMKFGFTHIRRISIMNCCSHLFEIGDVTPRTPTAVKSV